MATQNGPLDFTGSLAGLTFYARKDSTKTIVRQKTGPTKQQINTDPRFGRTKLMKAEWAGCTMGTHWVRRVLHPLDAVRDYNFVDSVSRLLKAVQKLDTIGEYGRRSVALSHYPHGLEGFAIAQKTPFDTLLRTPLVCTASKAILSARVQIPPIRAGWNFYSQTPHPYFRVVASLGVVPDIHYTAYGYAPKAPSGSCLPHVVATGWTVSKRAWKKPYWSYNCPTP